jgi:hypothetical protein
MTKIAGAGSISQRQGSGSVSKCHGSASQLSRDLDLHRPSKILSQTVTSGRQNHWSLTHILGLAQLLCFSVVRLNFWNIPKLWIQLVIPILLILSGESPYLYIGIILA